MTPDTHTIREEMLAVGNGHQLYVQEWGNPTAKTPIIYFKGGPGSALSDGAKGVFDPARHRVIFFDQRGCGKSLPFGSLEHNTTADLLGDTLKVVEHCKAKQVVAYGGSWGSTLALAFAQAHPHRVAAVIANGIFTASQAELDWIDKGEFRLFYPEVWERFLHSTPVEHRANPTPYHYKNILEGDAHLLFSSALAVNDMERSVMSMDDRHTPADPGTFDPGGTRIYAHYMANQCFLQERQLLKNAHKLTMPVWLVQGRYDMCCPPNTAYELHQLLPNGHLQFTISNHRVDHESDAVLRTILAQLPEL